MSGGVQTTFKWLAAVVVCAGVYLAWQHWFQSGPKSVAFRTATVQRGDFIDKVQATGTLEPEELIDVGAQMSGIITSFGKDENGKSIDYGSDVKQGQLLAVIDDTFVNLDIRKLEANVLQAKAAIARAEANIEQAQATWKQAKRDRDRAEKLGAGDALSQASFDQYISAEEAAAAALVSAKASLEEARASYASATAQLDREKENIKYVQITSPVDGTVIVRQVNVGQTVVSNMSASSLFLIARDLRRMQIWASVNEADITKVRKGQLVRYTVEGLPDVFEGVVNKIRLNATMTSNVVTYIVEIDIENPNRKLLPYMSANVDFVVKEDKGVCLVPNEVFSFMPPPAIVDATAAPETPAGRLPAHAATVWKRSGEGKVAPLLVLRGDDDGTRSVVTALDGGALPDGLELVSGIFELSEGEEAAAGSKNLFGMNPPKRRSRSTGEEAAAAPGSGKNAPANSSGKDRHGPPPM